MNTQQSDLEDGAAVSSLDRERAVCAWTDA
jgi:hypothetical protein